MSLLGALLLCFPCAHGSSPAGAPTSPADGLQQLWGTPILAMPIDAKTFQSLPRLEKHMRHLADTESPEVRSNRNGAWQSRNKKFLVPGSHPSDSGLRKDIKRLRRAIDAALRTYLVENLGGEGYEAEIEASWANVNPTGGINGPHVHPFSAISGAFYIACGGNASSVPPTPCAISLMDPRPSSALANLPSEVRNGLDFGIDWDLSIWPGTVLLFPSWLMHWVPPNAAPGLRMTISFNAGVKQKSAVGPGP
eukprot:TRINITY_DN6555_c1_g1_i3.p1 TRINITY_DN6555_c1_g1~~TRINITY_DN6555_c1_g1_i3.p1  ORF type:complete len:277 (+),score=45.46 TRINITY_DN6555_c1_g1_i3:81-833(+)